jgi:hypothetical protein
MAELPTFISTAQAPRTTGVGSPDYVENVDPMGKAIEKVGGTITDINQEMLKTRNAQAVNHAKLGATLKLDKLTLELSKKDPVAAMRLAPGRIKEIYNEQISGMSETAREEFDKTFTIMNGQAQTNIQTQAIKNHNDVEQANLLSLLDKLKRSYDPINNPLSDNLQTGLNALNTAIGGRVIKAKEGAKLWLKFRKGMAEEGVNKWINTQTADTLMDAYNQMDEGKIRNSAIQKLWDQLDEDKKKSMQTGAITVIDRLGVRIDKAEARKVKQAKKRARQDIFTVLDVETSEEDRDAAMKRLRDNPEGLNPNEFRQLLDDVAGRTSQFNKDDVVNGISTRILEGDGTLTEKEIATAEGVNFATKKRLIKELREAENEEFNLAKEIINTSPVFMPKSKADKLVYGDLMKAAKAKLLTQVIELRNKAIKDKKNFDAIGVTNALIKALVDAGDTKEITDGAIQQALGRLKARGITDEQSANKWIATNAPKMEVQLEIKNDLNIIKSGKKP